MSATFSWDEFERLKGMPMALYVIDCASTGNLPPDCVERVRTHAAGWDGPHLEMALSLLQRVDSDAARHEIVNFVGHPLQHIRLAVLGMLDGMEPIDEYMLGKVRERLPAATDGFERAILKKLEDQAADRMG